MAHKEMIYLKGYAKGQKYFQLLKCIHLFTKLHSGQFRLSGEEYIDHPMRVTSSLLALGVTDENTLAASLGHDIIEDCSISTSELVMEHQIDPDIVNLIDKLSKNKDITTEQYYKILLSDVRLVLIKLSDRCHNVSSMAGAFSLDKMKKYITETYEHVLPLCHKAKEIYPEYSDQFFVMKYHIESIVQTISSMIKLIENEKNTTCEGNAHVI